MERSVSSGGNLVERTSRSQVFEFFLSSGVVGHLNESFLERDGEGDEEISRVVFVDPGFDLCEPVHIVSSRQCLARAQRAEER